MRICDRCYCIGSCIDSLCKAISDAYLEIVTEKLKFSNQEFDKGASFCKQFCDNSYASNRFL